MLKRNIDEHLYPIEMKIKTILKSTALWMGLVFIAWLIFCYYYPRNWAVYEDRWDEILAPMQWYFIWMMGVGLWGFICIMIDIIRDED